MLLPALRGLRTWLIPRQTREKPSSAFAHPIADHNCNTSHWVKVLFFVVPISVPFIMHSPPCRSNYLLLLECSQSLPQGLWLHYLYFFNFSFGWHAKTCRVLSCRSRPYVTPHSSTTCTTVLSYLCNPFCYYQVLIPLFRSESPFRHAISPLYPNTSHDGSPEIPRDSDPFLESRTPLPPNVSAVV